MPGKKQPSKQEIRELENLLDEMKKIQFIDENPLDPDFISHMEAIRRLTEKIQKLNLGEEGGEVIVISSDDESDADADAEGAGAGAGAGAGSSSSRTTVIFKRSRSGSGSDSEREMPERKKVDHVSDEMKANLNKEVGESDLAYYERLVQTKRAANRVIAELRKSIDELSNVQTTGERAVQDLEYNQTVKRPMIEREIASVETRIEEIESKISSARTKREVRMKYATPADAARFENSFGRRRTKSSKKHARGTKQHVTFNDFFDAYMRKHSNGILPLSVLRHKAARKYTMGLMKFFM